MKRTNSHVVPESGVLECSEAGTCEGSGVLEHVRGGGVLEHVRRGCAGTCEERGVLEHVRRGCAGTCEGRGVLEHVRRGCAGTCDGVCAGANEWNYI